MGPYAHIHSIVTSFGSSHPSCAHPHFTFFQVQTKSKLKQLQPETWPNLENQTCCVENRRNLPTPMTLDAVVICQFRQWLLSNQRSGYTPAFNSIIATDNNALSWCDMEDLIAIFSNLKESNDPNLYTVDDLSALLSGMTVNHQ